MDSRGHYIRCTLFSVKEKSQYESYNVENYRAPPPPTQ